MASFIVPTLLLALFATATGDDEKHKGIIVYKCCGEFEMLSGVGKSCVKANWPQNITFQLNDFGRIVPPLDETWLRRWLPPGISLEKVKQVVIGRALSKFIKASVNASSVWNEQNSLSQDVWRKQVVFLDEQYIARPKPGQGKRKAWYCVDASSLPQEPFMLIFETQCNEEECVTKCCSIRQLMVNKKGDWKCEVDDEGYWSPFNSTFAKDLDPEFPFLTFSYVPPQLHITPQLRLAKRGDSSARWAGSPFHEVLFSTWQTCIDYYRNNGILQEGLFYLEYPRVKRGIYWILRPLCFLTAFLWAIILLSIACDRSMRQKVHGLCLASHALCLFGFNVGQIVYYVAVSDAVDGISFEKIPAELQSICTPLALSMYFLLMAAWFWLTFICVNMALGFRFQASFPSKSGKKRFIAYSVIAWGVPTVLTITCHFLFVPQDDFVMRLNYSPRYSPSLFETRMCYHEPFIKEDLAVGGYNTVSRKYGTAIFYYGPVWCLVSCNLVCLVTTLRKVHHLKRGNSVLRKEEDTRHTHTDGNLSSGNIGGDNERHCRNVGERRTVMDAKT